MSHAPSPTGVIDRLVGVYDADHTIRGELQYWIGARLGRAHCALCDITHGTFRERPDWIRCRDGMAVDFDTFHRDDQPAPIAEALGGRVPAVVAVTTAGAVVPLLGAGELEACDGAPEALADAVEDAVAAAGLAWPGPPG